jgi:Protein of unknown function (DUF3040)
VPLSEHEQRQLEQIEQALYAEHPRFAKAVRSADPQVHYKRRVVYAGVMFALGVALLLVGINTSPAVSVAGFVVMLGSCYWAAISYRRMNGIATGKLPVKDRRTGKAARATRKANKGPKMGMGERLDERWRRRQDGRDS